MKQLIIGLVGPIASGKGVVANHLKTLGFSLYSLSDRVRDEANKRGIPVNRENLQNVGNDLRRTFGPEVLAIRTSFMLINEKAPIVIDGLRNPAEIKFLKQAFNIVVIGIDAPTELRSRWYLERAVLRGEDGATLEEFFKANNRDSGIGEDSTGQQVQKCLEMTDRTIINTGSKAELVSSLESYLFDELRWSAEGQKFHNKEY